MSYAELMFMPQWAKLSEEHVQALQEARWRSQRTNNAGAMLPAEGTHYVAHLKELVIAIAS